MDVDALSFPDKLLDILVHISEADFVSLDLELSGIPSRLPGRKRIGRDRATLQDRYAEAKAGADRYQILQVGITCARFDYISNSYVLRPYNINLSPLVDERIDYEREISFQSGACTFLLNHNFDLGSPFAKGVPYLSREEAEHIRQSTLDRLEKKNPVEDLHLNKEDVQSLDFVRRAREAIQKWQLGAAASVTITSHTGLEEQPNAPTISNFEKRLVHQLVRAEFPQYISIGRYGCIKVTHFDAIREAENTKRVKKRVEDQITKQTGFRWVFEALAQDNADWASFGRKIKQFFGTTGHYDTTDRLNRAVENLKHKKTVLVGHNLFTDIVYIYRTFFGELPDTLDGFCDVINTIFPRIVDTKYLATYAEGDLNASPTLQDIAESLEDQLLPDIVTHGSHSKYHGNDAFHEAGFDSLLTAKIMIQLSAKLDFQLNYKVTLIAPDVPPVEDSGNASREVGARQRHKNKKQSSSPDKLSNGRFQTINIFDKLNELILDEEELTDEEATTGSTSTPTVSEARPTPKNSSSSRTIEKRRRKPMEVMPAFDDEGFWKVFGNKLRVFGTTEKLLLISDDFEIRDSATVV